MDESISRGEVDTIVEVVEPVIIDEGPTVVEEGQKIEEGEC